MVTAGVDLGVVREALAQIHHGDLTAADAAAILGPLRSIRSDCDLLIGHLESVLADVVAARGVTVLVASDGTRTTVQRRPARRVWVWDDDDLRTDVTSHARDQRRVDLATGEVLETEGDAVARVLGQVWPLDGRTARVGALRGLGIDPDRYRTQTGWAGGGIEVVG